MALDKKTFEIRFNQGLDTGEDPKTVIPSKFTTLDNVEFSLGSSLRQRAGYDQKTILAHTGSAIVSNVRRLHEYGEEVLLEATSGLHAYLREFTVSRDRISHLTADPNPRIFERANISYRDVADGQLSQTGIDAALAVTAQVECWVWQEDIFGIFYKVFDRVTQAIIQEGPVEAVAGGDTAVNPRVVARNNVDGSAQFYIYYLFTTGVTSSIYMKSLTVPPPV